MTAPDPLECLNSRASGGPILCGAPVTDHCAACLACTWGLNATCACPPLPAVGTQILPRNDIRDAYGYPVPHLPHTVVATWDHRRTGHPDDHVIVAQLTSDIEYANTLGQPVNTETGAYLDLDGFGGGLDQPRITFTAKETNS